MRTKRDWGKAFRRAAKETKGSFFGKKVIKLKMPVKIQAKKRKSTLFVMRKKKPFFGGV